VDLPVSQEDSYLAVKYAHQKMSKLCTEDTPMAGMPLIMGHHLDSFPKFRSFRVWNEGMDPTAEDELSYTPQYQEVFL
jgi:hypothetical protein